MNFLGTTPPFFIFKNSAVSTQIEQKWPYQTPLAAQFRDKYAPTSRKYVYVEPETRPLQWLN